MRLTKEAAEVKYQLEWCAWEITKRCNMNCDICLCGAPQSREDELTTEEALELCKELMDMGVKRVVLTGGEPLMRADWEVIAGSLTDAGVDVWIATNGTLIQEETVEKMKAAGVGRVTISIDGTEKIHDGIRAEGSFAKCRNAAELLLCAGIPVYAATTVTAENFNDLQELQLQLYDMKIKDWVIQLGLPYGNFVANDVNMLPPDKIKDLIDFCFSAVQEIPDMRIYPGDTIGYYTEKEILVRKHALGTDKIPVFAGCPAGISSLAIAADGDILTISMCVDRFIAGNIRETPLREIWEDDENAAWKWRRGLKKKNLKGACRECPYAEICLEGCPAVRYAMTGDVMGENKMCAFLD